MSDYERGYRAGIEAARQALESVKLTPDGRPLSRYKGYHNEGIDMALRMLDTIVILPDDPEPAPTPDALTQREREALASLARYGPPYGNETAPPAVALIDPRELTEQEKAWGEALGQELEATLRRQEEANTALREAVCAPAPDGEEGRGVEGNGPRFVGVLERLREVQAVDHDEQVAQRVEQVVFAPGVNIVLPAPPQEEADRERTE